jgi:hypothetical protein
MKFNNFKNRVFSTILESYLNNDKNKIKEIVKILKSDKDLKDVFLFYESIENKNVPKNIDINDYVETISNELPKKYSKLKNKISQIEKHLNENKTNNESLICENLDIILNNDGSLNKLGDVVLAKNNLKNYLRENTDNPENIETFVSNQKALNTVLTNNFNLQFESVLSDDDKKYLQEIVNLNGKELNTKYNSLKEDVLSKINNLLNEENDNDLKEKLVLVKDEINENKISKLNLYRLIELNNSI